MWRWDVLGLICKSIKTLSAVNGDSYLTCFLQELSTEHLNKLYIPKSEMKVFPNIRTRNSQNLQK